MEVFNIKQDFLINEQIRFAEVQVINENGEKLGKINTNKAIEMAYEQLEKCDNELIYLEGELAFLEKAESQKDIVPSV